MKFFTVFAAIVAVALGSQASWTLPQLSDAIQNPNTDPALLPYLENALNEMMSALHAGHQIEAIAVTIPSIDLSAWTLAELSDALQNPTTDAALIPYLEQALNEMMLAIVSGTPQQVVPVVVPAMDISSWTLSELSAALQNPATNPALVPYLEHALNEIMLALMSGQQMESIAIAIPAGLLPVEGSPAPIPVVPTPVDTPIVPSPVETPVGPAPSSPLVQIIINVNQQAGSPVAPAPVDIVDVMPVVVEQTPVVVEPVQVIDTPAVIEPVIIGAPTIPAIVEPVIIGAPTIPAAVEPVQVVDLPTVIEPVIIGAPVIPVA